MQILCVVSQKMLKLLGDEDPLPGHCPWTPLGDFCPPVFFYVPPIIP